MSEQSKQELESLKEYCEEEAKWARAKSNNSTVSRDRELAKKLHKVADAHSDVVKHIEERSGK